MRAIIASGADGYADPWHPFPKTTPLLADILATAGFDVGVDEDVDRAMTRLNGVDLLVVNAGDPWRGERASAPRQAIEALASALDRGIGVLALHCAVASLRDYPEWAAAIGAMWVPGASHHPDADDSVVRGFTLPDGNAIAGFTVFDERYCRLQRIGRSTVVAEHAGDGEPEPAMWVRTVGTSRIAVDVLGHDERSYASEGHRTAITSLALWATGNRSPAH